MNNNKQRPDWMYDELVQKIPPEKLDFLGTLFQEGHGKTQKEMMSFILPMMRKAKQENLTFSMDEMNAAISAIKKHSNEEELQQIDNLLKKVKNGG